MASDDQAAAPQGPRPLTAAARQRLQKVFEHAQRCFEKADYDYANQLFAQCVVEDPANDVYLQKFLENLQTKYGNNKKGAKFAGLKIKSHRSALAKAAGKGEWEAAFQAGCAALALNPWDTPTLLALARACRELHIDECQLRYLKWAMQLDHKDPVVNREAALTLQQMGQFDQAIACWHRVEQAKPHDDEALQAISRLSVEKTIHQGGYDPAMLDKSGGDAKKAGKSGVARIARQSESESEDAASDDEPKVPLEQRLQQAVAADPTDVSKAAELADLYLHEQRLDDAQQVLQRASEAAGGGNLRIRERLEDVQLRKAEHQLKQAQRHYDHETTEEAKATLDQAKSQANQVELEIALARAEREPQNPRLQYELGLRLKRAGKHKEAIQALQAARSDPKRRQAVFLELGECFQRIEQYKLALSNYEESLAASENTDDDVTKLALYRAGVLCTGLRELDRAERHLTQLAGLDFGYRDVAERLDKINRLRNSG